MASFTTTWMDDEAEKLIAETQAINIVDNSQYPQAKEMENRSGFYCHALLRCAPMQLVLLVLLVLAFQPWKGS